MKLKLKQFQQFARVLFVATCSGGLAALGSETPPTPVTLEDLYSDTDTRDAAVSPSGRYLAAIVRQEPNDLIVIQDLETGARNIASSISRTGAGERFETRMSAVYWKSDERLLFRAQVRPKPGARLENLTRGNFGKLGDRMFAINRDGTKAVRLLSSNRETALEGALNLGAIGSMLANDPDHVLLLVDGFAGPSIYRVDVHTGDGTVVERPSEDVVAWWLDVNGSPLVRVQRKLGTLRFQRKVENRWKEYYRVAVKEMLARPDYSPIGPSNQPGKFYVLARPPGRERTGIYLYDLSAEHFGEPIAEHPQYDIDSAHAARDGSGLLHYCYVAHVRICEITEPQVNAHMKGLRKFFNDAANVYVFDISRDSNTMALYVEGPVSPPAYYYYRVNARRIEFIGFVRNSLFNKPAPIATVETWKARDGRDITGYLTLPAGSRNAGPLPLIVYPHGGPEARDQLEYHPWVQFFTSRGYAVFQPNFRGSNGFGRGFAESGYGEWGRAMQHDLTDGLTSLIARKIADPQRVCILGGSYGGYAALAGAAFTPDLYRCAISIAGVSDLSAYVKWYKFEYGPDSAGSAYWTRAIGDPEADAHKLRAFSPALHADAIKADVLLIHGKNDGVVPVSQSLAMKRALDQAKRRVTYLEIEDEGHSYWSRESEKMTLENIDAFLAKNLGPGFRPSTSTENPNAE